MASIREKNYTNLRKLKSKENWMNLCPSDQKMNHGFNWEKELHIFTQIDIERKFDEFMSKWPADESWLQFEKIITQIYVNWY